MPRFDKSYSYEQLQNKILYYINYRIRTEKEVIQKLKTLNATEEQINQLLQELKGLGLINDEKFLPFFVREYFEIKKLSIFQCRSKLQQLGFDSYLIEEQLNSYIDEENFSEIEQATALLMQKYHQPLEDQQKMLAFLGRKGFSYSIGQKALKDFLYQFQN